MARSDIPRSERLFAASSRILPAASTARSAPSRRSARTPLFIERARGARIEDADGNTYIDYVMSWGPLIHGHAPKGLLKALAAAAARGTSFGAPTELETRLAQRVAMLMPSMERVRFVSSGTEAAMSAVRVARAATKRDRIIKFEGCYHGHADAFLVQAGSGAMTLGVPTSPGVPAAAAADTLLARYNDLDVGAAAVRRTPRHDRRDHRRADRRQHGAGAAARRLSRGAARRSATAKAALLIFDEVISGFRAATGRRAEGLRRPAGPDLPRQDHRRRAAGRRLRRTRRADGAGRAGGPVYQAGTLSGNPLAMTAGLWSLEDLSPRLYRHLAKLGAQLAAGLADAARDAGVPLQVNAFGSLLTPFFTEQPVRDFQSALTADTARYGAFFRAMLARGVYLPPSQFEAWFLSGAHTPARRRADGAAPRVRRSTESLIAEG